MRRMKLFPKIFLYTLGVMLFVIAATHGLIYLLAPRMQFMVDTQEEIVISINQARLVAGAVERALPVSLACSLLIAVMCSLLFSKTIADPIREISAATGQMRQLDRGAACMVHTEDEIGVLSRNVNALYGSLLATIEHLEREKDAVRDMERSRADFLRAASHELKTPVTALNATLENMILGVGKYRDYTARLPECREMVEQLSGMIQEILDASRLNPAAEQAEEVDLPALLAELCEPYRRIAAAREISFSLAMPEQFSAMLPVDTFRKAVSNVLANAAAYTQAGAAVRVFMDGRSLIIENECKPIPADILPRLFEPFYRPDFSRSREDGGNGLGLYIVDSLLTAIHIPYSFVPVGNPPGMRFIISL